MKKQTFYIWLTLLLFIGSLTAVILYHNNNVLSDELMKEEGFTKTNIENVDVSVDDNVVSLSDDKPSVEIEYINVNEAENFDDFKDQVKKKLEEYK